MAIGKRLTVLEMPEDEEDEVSEAASARAPTPAPQKEPSPSSRASSIPLPPIPAAPRREIMVQLSIKAPLALIERLEALTKTTGAQKQAVLAAALDAYLHGHGY